MKIDNYIHYSHLDFETEYQLNEFREIQSEHFDEFGKVFTNHTSPNLCEQMLKLINQLEIALTPPKIRDNK